MIKKVHHYIPRFFLRNFSSNGKSIWKYVKDKKLFISNSSISKTWGNYKFYWDDLYVEDFLAKIEYNASIVISKIIKEVKIPSKNTSEYFYLIMFTIQMFFRIPKNLEYSKIKGRDFCKNCISEDNKETINKFSFEMWRQKIIESIYLFSPSLFDLSPKILLNKTSIPFISWDSITIPINYLFNEKLRREINKNFKWTSLKMEKWFCWGFLMKGYCLVFPISEKIWIILVDDLSYKWLGKTDLISLNESNMFYLNKILLEQAINEIYFWESVNNKAFFDVLDKKTKFKKLNFLRYKKQLQSYKNLSEIYRKDFLCNFIMEKVIQNRRRYFEAKQIITSSISIEDLNDEFNKLIWELNDIKDKNIDSFLEFLKKENLFFNWIESPSTKI